MNNFDQSSSGINLELSCFFDADLARYDFDDSFIKLQNDIWLFVNHGNVSKDFSLSDFNNYQVTKAELQKAIKDQYNDYMCLLEESQYYMEKTFTSLNKDELQELIGNILYSEFEIIDFLQKYFTPKFDQVASRGSCQGDLVEVIISQDYWKTHGIERTDRAVKDLSGYIDQLFWSSPIYCRFDIDSEEYFLDEYLKDVYTYNKDLIIEKFKKDLQHEKKEYILSWLDENLPEYPDFC